jgi:type II secretory pathway component PulF
MAEALQPRRLPEIYKRMILVGVKSGDLPGALTMLADYFQRQTNLWTRLKGLMVYPLIVLFMAFCLSCFIWYLLNNFIWNNFESLTGQKLAPGIAAGLWMSPVCIGIALIVGVIAVSVSPARRRLRWRLPAFKEASLAQVAAAMCLMLKHGVPLNDALAFAEQLEEGTGAEKEIAQWRLRLASGHGKFSDMAVQNIAVSGGIFPPLFVWTVSQSGEDLTTGFERVAKIYDARANYRVEMFLYSLLPIAVLALGTMIISQIQPVLGALTAFISSLSEY